MFLPAIEIFNYISPLLLTRQISKVNLSIGTAGIKTGTETKTGSGTVIKTKNQHNHVVHL